ncbi:Z-ring formation inhibitor MciZ [Paenibacillus ginsengihumi]|uniref:Z-ring formation inhibitor MciZ n=1 Tax=Paenibacillus ginsengihumi TaxID=431596 RepID=UPI0003645163|nr:Z-ring formation inhibitor MciZ [Paenibacillus ginsengihumi]
MKAYLAPEQLRLVGKGWEIRHYLKMALKRSTGSPLLADWLPRERNRPANKVSPRPFKRVNRILSAVERGKS